MIIQDKIQAFAELQNRIKSLSDQEMQELSERTRQENGWFDESNIRRAFEGIVFMLEEQKLEKWIANYQRCPEVPKIVGIIMAGNIPMVGFHDLLCVLISGHIAAIKPSSQDAFLTYQITAWLTEIEPRFTNNIEIKDKLDRIDAVICTGSDNTARYFQHYFGRYPNIIRKNRTSVAILDGNETTNELKKLGEDVFTYYGLGCRNVSKLYVPKNYDFLLLFEAWESYEKVIHHHKYKNNYDYNKTILLVNEEPHLDNGFVIMKENNEIASPISVIYYQFYKDSSDLEKFICTDAEKIQCIIGRDYLPFGQAQFPELWDFADGVNTMKFLMDLV